MEKNFMDLFDMMSPEDRDKMIGNLLKNIKGEPTEPILSRITFKISSLGSEEEIQQRIADAMGISLNELPQSNARAEIERNRANWMAVCDVIQPYKSFLESTAKTTNDKFEELTDLGRFIIAFPDKLEIVIGDTPLKYPDFIVKRGNQNIGIEHTRLMDKNLKATFEAAKQFLENARSKLTSRDKKLSGTVNVFINFNKSVINDKDFNTRGFTPSEKNQISSLIADYIESEIKNMDIQKPAFIDRIVFTDNKESRLDIILAEKYIAKDGFTDLLNLRIQAKESRFRNYIAEASVEKCWLLIVVDGISSFSGFDLKTEDMNIVSSQKFEKIILFESFGATISYL
jgi:ssRNA-specific RNase YbeY (16S rRNA maturation enzyme)